MLEEWTRRYRNVKESTTYPTWKWKEASEMTFEWESGEEEEEGWFRKNEQHMNS